MVLNILSFLLLTETACNIDFASQVVMNKKVFKNGG